MLTVRGLVSNWEFVVYVRFDYTLDCETYKEIIVKLHEIGYKVLLSICDQGPRNMSLINKDNLNLSPQKPDFPHPADENLKMRFCFDFVHLLKSLGRHIRTDICMLPCGALFTVADFQELIDSCMSEIGFPFKQIDLDAEGQQSQKVSHTTNILHEMTADLIEKRHPNDPRLLKVAKMCRVFGKGFKVLTSHHSGPQDDRLHSALGALSS